MCILRDANQELVAQYVVSGLIDTPSILSPIPINN